MSEYLTVKGNVVKPHYDCAEWLFLSPTPKTGVGKLDTFGRFWELRSKQKVVKIVFVRRDGEA